ncbi:hypothetical protein V9T40_005048 [Parthenolecanium corni]|uniref:Uncharacterized protein n=1 Tax=Parthenolecanium corni TaxID=536013 RepID=A0AAN9Y3N6_9HEMI
MDILPSGNIFSELQDIHDTGYFSAQSSLEDHWQQKDLDAPFLKGPGGVIYYILQSNMTPPGPVSNRVKHGFSSVNHVKSQSVFQDNHPDCLEI